MRTPLRSLLLATAALIGLASSAQNVITIQGTVSPCQGVVYPVHIVIGNGVDMIDTTVYTTANCWYSCLLYPTSAQTSGTVSTSCDGGITWTTENVTWSPFLQVVTVDLTCGSPGCQACFTYSSNQPWEILFSNCSSINSAPPTFSWLFSDGSISTTDNPIWNVTTEGYYTACLTVSDASGCTSTICDSMYVDSNGNLNPVFVPCYACVYAAPVTNGPAGPAIPWAIQAVNCSSGGVAPVNYYYDWNTGETTQSITTTTSGWYFVCITMVDANNCTSTACDSAWVDENGTVDPVITAPCEAGFWVMQAYTIDSLNPNGAGVPTPNELWIWNLSSGGTGNYQFVWSWGDGTPNSTDPFPTHFYANGGPYVLCLTMYDGSCTDTYCDSVTVDQDGFYTGMVLIEEDHYARSGFTVNVLNQLPTGIADRPTVDEPRLWPNPVEEQLNLSFNTNLNGNVPMMIVDMNGRTVRNENVRVSGGANKLDLAVSDLAPGLYMLRFQIGAKAVAFRFVKR